MEKRLERKQREWGDGIVWIGAAATWEESSKRAASFIEEQYVLDGTLLFAPTLARQIPFRPHFEGILSYFVGKNPEYEEDLGFAIRPWTAVRFENAGVVETGGLTLAMGMYTFTDTLGAETRVEYTFGYRMTGEELGPIQLHHSALPFEG